MLLPLIWTRVTSYMDSSLRRDLNTMSSESSVASASSLRDMLPSSLSSTALSLELSSLSFFVAAA